MELIRVEDQLGLSSLGRMGFAVNLLHRAPGRASIEMVLALDPASFEPRHVRAVLEGTADYLGINREEVEVRGVARWQPIV